MNRRKFSCDGCAAAPRLQKLNGCFVEIQPVVAVIAGYEFHSCPVAAFGAKEEYVGGLARIHALKKSTPLEAIRLPAQLFAALQWCEDLLREHEDDYRT